MADMSRLAELFAREEVRLLTEWLEAQSSSDKLRQRSYSEKQRHDDSVEFLNGLRGALQAGAPAEITDVAWGPLRQRLDKIARNRAEVGFSPVETATLIFSLK